jgi:hypothetical protein
MPYATPRSRDVNFGDRMTLHGAERKSLANIMVFDATARPANGAYPALACPARRAFRRDRFDSQGFRFGVFWAASSTPITLTFLPTAQLRVDVEVLT